VPYQASRQQFSIKVGTIFEDSPIGLDKWLPAVWMLVNDKNGVSSYEVARALGVTQKTGWFMLHRIRLAMKTESFRMMGGDVEIDETFIGGKAKYMHRSRRNRTLQHKTGAGGKAVVMGLLERSPKKGHSRVRVRMVKNNARLTLEPEIHATVKAGANIFTDYHSAYWKLQGRYIHEMVDHAKEYVRGKVHTNGMENFWSLLKRSIRGTYVSVEPFHLFRYLDEQAFRFNTRKGSDASRFIQAAASIVGRRLTYRALTGAAAPQTC